MGSPKFIEGHITEDNPADVKDAATLRMSYPSRMGCMLGMCVLVLHHLENSPYSCETPRMPEWTCCLLYHSRSLLRRQLQRIYAPADNVRRRNLRTYAFRSGIYTMNQR